MAKGIKPKWETQFWDLITEPLSTQESHGCPSYEYCMKDPRSNWCPVEHSAQLLLVSDIPDVGIESFNFIPKSECRGVMRMARLLSERLLREHGVIKPPTPTKLVYELFKGEIEYRFLSLNACHGATWQFKDEIVIFINKNDTPFEKRLTLFHEVFHALVMEQIGPEKRSNYRRSAFTEVMATYFTACILMPHKMVVQAWSELGDIDAMSRLFRVPRSSICIALKRLGLA